MEETKMNLQSYNRQKYNLTGFVKKADLTYTELNGRCYVEINGKSAAVITSTRRPNLTPRLKNQSLRGYADVREVWYRNFELKDVGINQFKDSRRNADKTIDNTWAVTYLCKLTDIRYIYAYVDNQLCMNLSFPKRRV
jgi:hypothetical protein